MNITDKELLTFCNLINLKMEYITLKQQDTITQISNENTIYSLLHGDEFIDAANKKDFSGYMEKLKGEVFVDKYTDEEGNFKIDDSKQGRRVYTKDDNLLEISPIVFDCLGNENDKFLQEWEIAYSGDTFLITLDFFRYTIPTKNDLVRVA